MRSRLSALLVAVATVSVLTACGQSDDGPQDDVPTVTPATAERSPAGGPAPTGSIVALPPSATIVAARGDRDAVAVLDEAGRTVRLFATSPAAEGPDDRTTVDWTTPPREIPVPELTALAADRDGFVGAGPAGIVHLSATGEISEQAADLTGVLSVAALPDGRTLVGTDRGRLLVFARDGSRQRDIGGWVRVDDITVAPETAGDRAGQVVVLDRAQSAVTPVDVDSGEHKAALRAGDGATHSTVDRYGRVLVSGTRNNEFYAYYGQPIVMRMRAPVPASPFALAYDSARNLLWISSTASNTAVAYALDSGEAVEKHRIATVPQVAAMDVDPTSGALLMVSARDGGLQVVDTAAVS